MTDESSRIKVQTPVVVASTCADEQRTGEGCFRRVHRPRESVRAIGQLPHVQGALLGWGLVMGQSRFL